MLPLGTSSLNPELPTWIRDWHITGPFPYPGKDLKVALAARQWPEEAVFKPEAPPEDGRTWKFVHAKRDVFDLNWLKPSDRVTAYASIRVWSPVKQNAILEIRVDDDAKAWMNGRLVMKEAPLGKSHRAAVKLSEGDNVLLVKVAETTGGFWMAARILGKDGEALRDLQYW